MNTSANHMPYKLRCLALAAGKSVWSVQLYKSMCSELQVDEKDVDTTKTGGYTLVELREMGMDV